MDSSQTIIEAPKSTGSVAALAERIARQTMEEALESEGATPVQKEVDVVVNDVPGTYISMWVPACGC